MPGFTAGRYDDLESHDSEDIALHLLFFACMHIYRESERDTDRQRRWHVQSLCATLKSGNRNRSYLRRSKVGEMIYIYIYMNLVKWAEPGQIYGVLLISDAQNRGKYAWLPSFTHWHNARIGFPCISLSDYPLSEYSCRVG